MKYNKQVEAFVNYFRKGEKKPSHFKTGTEFEHFIVHKKSLKSVSYFEDRGIEKLLEELVHKGWRPKKKEDNHILLLEKGNASISLEPGGQLELDIRPERCIGNMENTYLCFLEDIVPVLEKQNKMIMALGYHPESSIEDLSLLPKKRYGYMYSYLEKRGKYAHNMMKGTASTQVCVDYSSEQDMVKKSRVSAFLTPVIYCIFDNTPFFEGEICKRNSMRNIIWANCDCDRCGLPDKIFFDGYGYESYAEYILNKPPIIMMKGKHMFFTSDTPLKEVFDPETITEDEIDHALSMFFFDIRLRSYIELRMGDSLPYPYNIGYAALWKGLLYDGKNLNLLYEESKKYDFEDMQVLNQEILQKGIHANITGKTVIEYFINITAMAGKGLDCCERSYLSPIADMLEKGLTPRQATLDNLHKDKVEALKWCSLNEVNNMKRCDKIACC